MSETEKGTLVKEYTIYSLRDESKEITLLEGLELVEAATPQTVKTILLRLGIADLAKLGTPSTRRKITVTIMVQPDI